MLDLAVLEFARDHAFDPDAENEIRARFGSPVRFYQRLGRALIEPAALRHDPALRHSSTDSAMNGTVGGQRDVSDD